MSWLDRCRRRVPRRPAPPLDARLELLPLEERAAPAATASLAAGLLSITGGAEVNRITVVRNAAASQIVVKDGGLQIGAFAAGDVSEIKADLGGGHDTARVAAEIMQPVTLMGGSGNDLLVAGGGPTLLDGGDGVDRLYGGNAGDTLLGGAGNDYLRPGRGADMIDGGAGADRIENIQPADTLTPDPLDRLRFAPVPPVPLSAVMDAALVQTLLCRASAATQSTDAIIAVVDRNGRILGVRVEAGVDPAITGDPERLTFAVDGAVAKARTAAFFANNAAPLTSRTVQFISQTTMIRDEIHSAPNVTGLPFGPGFVAPVGTKGHFPPDVPFTPQVDLFAIEHTNRDSAAANPGPDNVRGTADDVMLVGERFNIDPADMVPGKHLYAPESYGKVSGLDPAAQSRGIATLPGGIPIYRIRKDARGNVVAKELLGGIGVFFPGKNGFASEENSSLSTEFNPAKPDRTLEAEFMAFAAANGTLDIDIPPLPDCPPIPDDIKIPINSRRARIDLVGITLDIIGPGGLNGPRFLMKFAAANFTFAPPSGMDLPVTTGGDLYVAGLPVADGWIVKPHDGAGVTAVQVETIINAGIRQADRTRAAIRLPLDSRTRMVFAVCDTNGEVLGLYRMPDSTVFSIDVAVAKARNVAYYADAAALQPEDRLPGIPAGTAFTNRTFRYLALPRYPEGIEGKPPGIWSILNPGGSIQGYDAYHVGTNFHDPDNPENQNGVVFFPGSAPLYAGGALIGGFGVSGDGVDQDDVVTAAGAANFRPPAAIRADRFFFRGVRLPYQKFNRNPEG